MKSYAFLFWAYNVVWALLAGFVVATIVRLVRAERRLEGLEREIRRRER